MCGEATGNLGNIGGPFFSRGSSVDWREESLCSSFDSLGIISINRAVVVGGGGGGGRGKNKFHFWRQWKRPGRYSKVKGLFVTVQVVEEVAGERRPHIFGPEMDETAWERKERMLLPANAVIWTKLSLQETYFPLFNDGSLFYDEWL